MQGSFSSGSGTKYRQWENLCELLNSNMETEHITPTMNVEVLELQIKNQILTECNLSQNKNGDATLCLNGRSVYIHDFLLKAHEITYLINFPMYFQHAVVRYMLHHHHNSQLHHHHNRHVQCHDVESLLTSNNMVVESLMIVACKLLLYPRVLLDVSTGSDNREQFSVGEKLKCCGALLHIREILSKELSIMAHSLSNLNTDVPGLSTQRPYSCFPYGWTDGEDLYAYCDDSFQQVLLFPMHFSRTVTNFGQVPKVFGRVPKLTLCPYSYVGHLYTITIQSPSLTIIFHLKEF